MNFTFQMEVLEYNERTRSYHVHYCTPELMAYYEKNELPARIANLKQAAAQLTDQEAEKQARRIWPAGELRWVTVFDPVPPKGAALLDLLQKACPQVHLQHRLLSIQSSALDESIVGKVFDSQTTEGGEPVARVTIMPVEDLSQ
jgi:hypothetical protein